MPSQIYPHLTVYMYKPIRNQSLKYIRTRLLRQLRAHSRIPLLSQYAALIGQLKRYMRGI